MSSQTLVMPCPGCDGAIVATLYRIMPDDTDEAGNRLQHFERGCVRVSNPPCESYQRAREDGAWAFMELIVKAHSLHRDEMASIVRGVDASAASHGGRAHVLNWTDPTDESGS